MNKYNEEKKNAGLKKSKKMVPKNKVVGVGKENNKEDKKDFVPKKKGKK